MWSFLFNHMGLGLSYNIQGRIQDFKLGGRT
jgi:hypothetical protein